MNHIEFFIEKLNKSLFYSLSIGSHTIVSINTLKNFKNCTLQHNSYNTSILYDYTIISAKKCQDGEKRDLSWRFIFTFFQHYLLTVYQDKS